MMPVAKMLFLLQIPFVYWWVFPFEKLANNGADTTPWGREKC